VRRAEPPHPSGQRASEVAVGPQLSESIGQARQDGSRVDGHGGGARRPPCGRETETALSPRACFCGARGRL
jgi:hypothetical protein